MSSPILVNISSGLFSGATIGLLTSITQYHKIRSQFFVELFTVLKEYYKVFVVDDELLSKSITFLREHDIDEINNCTGFKDFTEVNNDIIERYNNCSSTFSCSDYVPLNPFDRTSRKLLKKIDFEIWFTRSEVLKFHSELLPVTELQEPSDIDDCIAARVMVYSALSIGVQQIFYYTEAIAQRQNLTNTKEYRNWLEYADDAYSSISENQEYILYGGPLDEFDDEEECCCISDNQIII